MRVSDVCVPLERLRPSTPVCALKEGWVTAEVVGTLLCRSGRLRRPDVSRFNDRPHRTLHAIPANPVLRRDRLTIYADASRASLQRLVRRSRDSRAAFWIGWNGDNVRRSLSREVKLSRSESNGRAVWARRTARACRWLAANYAAAGDPPSSAEEPLTDHRALFDVL